MACYASMKEMRQLKKIYKTCKEVSEADCIAFHNKQGHLCQYCLTESEWGSGEEPDLCRVYKKET